MGKNLFGKDRAIVVLFIFLGVAGLWLFKEKETSVFPTASIDLKIDKSQILKMADNWAERLGYNKKPLVKSIVFEDDEKSKTFLDYELGNTQADELMRDQIPIFYWECKFRKPFDQETMEIQISPSGNLVAFVHNIANDKKIVSITHSEAEKKAFEFVEENTGWRETDCKLVTDIKTAQINRTDYKFTWEYQKLDWHGAKLRSDVEIAGNTISGFDHYLKRPETWDRNYATIRTNNTLLEAVASIFFFSLYPIAAFIFLQGLSRKNIRWRFVIWTTAILILIFLAESFNNFPVLLASYSPDTSYKVFILQSIIYPLLGAPLFALLVATMAGAGEIVYRKLFPDKLALEKLFTKAGLGSDEVLTGLIIGLAWFGMMLGYQILYYWLGKNFNFWCPLEVDNYQTLSTYCPWIGAVNLGAMASTNEEILYRVLMLGLTKFAVRRFWLANILQAAAWGFMHSTYPQQPCYARGLELTIEGMAEGWLINRFGLLSCVIAHYSFDAFACITPLLSAPLSLKLSAFIPFLPVLIAIFYSRILGSKSNTHDEHLSNKTIPAPEAIASQSEISNLDPIAKYEPLTKFSRWTLTLCGVLGLCIILGIRNNFETIGANAKSLHVTRTEAIDKARAYLISKHFDLTGYKIATSLSDSLPDHDEIQYLYEQIGYTKTKKIIREVTSSFTWNVKFVKPLVSTEFNCDIDENGKLSGFSIEKGEDEPGANLSQENAQVIAENFLKKDPTFIPFKLDDVSVDKKKNRTDYMFTFTIPKFKVGDAELKVTINVIGDIASDSSWGWDLPDKWKWDRAKRSSREEILSIVSMIAYIVASLALVYWIVVLFRTNRVRWRQALILGGILTFCALVNGLNTLTTFFNLYKNTIPINSFFIITGITGLIGLLFIFAGTVFGIAIVLAGTTESIKLRVKTVLYEASLNFSKHLSLKTYREMILDALILGISSISILSFGFLGSRILHFYFCHEVSITKPSTYLTTTANSFLGPISIGTTLAIQLISLPLALGLLIAICKQLRLISYWRVLGASVLIYILGNLGARYWQDFLLGLVSGAISSSILWFVITKAFNRNILSIFAFGWLTYTCSLVAELWKFGWPTFTTEMVIGTVLLALPFFALAYVYVVPSMHNNKEEGSS